MGIKIKNIIQTIKQFLSKDKLINHCKTWSKEEINYLQEHYKNTCIKQLIKSLMRSKMSIYHKADRLNLNKEEGYYNFDSNPNWKGGKFKRKRDGYIFILAKYHPYQDENGYVPEHRLIIERKLKRFLKPIEVVHHKNKKRDDNRIKNLKLFASQSKHKSFHMQEEIN